MTSFIPGLLVEVEHSRSVSFKVRELCAHKPSLTSNYRSLNVSTTIFRPFQLTDGKKRESSTSLMSESMVTRKAANHVFVFVQLCPWKTLSTENRFLVTGRKQVRPSLIWRHLEADLIRRVNNSRLISLFHIQLDQPASPRMSWWSLNSTSVLENWSLQSGPGLIESLQPGHRMHID